MEKVTMLVLSYPFSLIFLIFVCVYSVSHLVENRKIFTTNYKFVMWVFVPASLLLLSVILYCFAVDTYKYGPTFVFFSLAYISSEFKRIFPRTTKQDRVKEVIGRYTPKFPSSGNKWNIQMWHLKMDLLALMGLWFFIFFDYVFISWIKSFF